VFNARIFPVVVCLLTLLWSGGALALTPGQHVENFKLLDHSGRTHELYSLADKKAIVLMVQGTGCPADRRALSTYRTLRAEYRDEGVAFLMLNSNLQDNRARIAREAVTLDNDFPILVDETQLIGESLGVLRTTEAFIIDPGDWTLKYRGSLDDRLAYEIEAESADENHVAKALDKVTRGRSVDVARTEPKGCLVSLRGGNGRHRSARISYTDDVAPILIENCVACHRDKARGSFSMDRYSSIRGFAPAIRAMVRTQRLPPRHANFTFNEFSSEFSLTVEETRTLVHWVEAGAPRGQGSDPLVRMEGEQREEPLWSYSQSATIFPMPRNEFAPEH